MRKLLASLALALAAEPCAGARQFTTASSEYLQVESAIVTATPASISAWIYMDSVTGVHAVFWLGDKDAISDNWRCLMRGDIAGDPIQAFTSAGAGQTTTGVTISTWHHVLCVFASNASRSAYIDGGSKGTNTTSMTPAAFDRTSIGGSRDSTPDNYFGGRIAEVALWSVALSDDDAVSLAKGVSPLLVRSASLEAYWPLSSRASPEVDIVGGYAMSLTGTSTADHVRFRRKTYGQSRWWSVAAAPAAGQPAMRRWESVPFMPSGRGRGGIRMLTDTVPSLEEIPCVGCSR